MNTGLGDAGNRQSTSLVVSRQVAQMLAVIKQGLAQRPSVADKGALQNTVRRLGLLQLDTINVVDRSHYLVMFSRLGCYDRSTLDSLLYPDRFLFEQWAHAACLIPAEDYEYFAPVIHARRDQPLRERKAKALGSDPKATLDSILTAVAEHGPRMSRDFEEPRGRAGTWWDHKPAKIALDYLFHTGYLMIERRINFQCAYNLAQRVLPESALPIRRSVADWLHWAILRSVGCLGVGTVSHIADYYRQTVPITRATLKALEQNGEVLRAEVEGWHEPAYILPTDISLIREIEAERHQPSVTTFLSPFDNLIWHRPRVRALFDFDYRIEMYTPLAKRHRVYGYYVMPILRRGHLIGRLDPKVDRKTRALIIHNFYLEQDEQITDELMDDLAKAFIEFMAFHQCQSVNIERAEPASLKTTLFNRIANFPHTTKDF